MKREVAGWIDDVLSGVMPLLELRGGDRHARLTGDLDFMVPPGKAIEACHLVARAAELRGWFLACYRNIGYLAQIVIIQPVENGTDLAIKIDFFDGLRWYGVGNDKAGKNLFGKLYFRYNNKACLAGVAGFFQKIVIVGRQNERDWLRVADAGVTPDTLTTLATELTLPLTKQQVNERGVTGLAKWRLRAASGGAISFLSIVPWFFCAVWAHIKFKLGVGTNSGIILGISGLDGSGKSTLVDRLLAAYSMAGGEQPLLIHLLPRWIPLPHQIFRRKKTQTNYTRPYSEPPVKSRLSGGVRLGYYLGAFFMARLWLGVKAVRGRVLIMDRSVVDFGSDPTRSRISVKKLPDWLLRLLVPHGRLFYLDASPEAVVARKGELTLEKAQSLQAAYRSTCTSLSVTMLNGNEAPDTVFRELLGHLSSEYMRRIEAEVVTK